ncbi:hypothetical protein QVD17_27689 [Tagetes erecta]|uniref:Late embryogenesis abundant protein LEA-2 subgroup domain-containing protein n=1 Tax=Tagetes erecta TaxID=13708 RepID=A0AAD8K9H5_TARER|nr:hypothetical protein QVD17_27689 [Tagetes erecta]
MQSDIDTNSLNNGYTSTSSTSPKCTYIVQTPSSTNTPAHSPSHSRMSSESRVSGPYRFSMMGKHDDHQQVLKKKKKGWPPLFSVIDEEDEGGYGEGDYNDEQVTRIRCRVVMALMGFVMVFVTVCLVTWCVATSYKLKLQMKSWKLNNFYYGEGSDYTGVPTKLLTINCSVKMNVQNPATFFGVHVSARPLNLFYSQIKVGSGQFMDYYQPKKSERIISINVEGQKVPLYGVGEGLVMSNDDGSVPLKLKFEIRSQAYLVGSLVKTMQRRQVLCIMKIDIQSNKVFDFKEDSCSYI